jgi:hypothetical protein
VTLLKKAQCAACSTSTVRGESDEKVGGEEEEEGPIEAEASAAAAAAAAPPAPPPPPEEITRLLSTVECLQGAGSGSTSVAKAVSGSTSRRAESDRSAAKPERATTVTLKPGPETLWRSRFVAELSSPSPSASLTSPVSAPPPMRGLLRKGSEGEEDCERGGGGGEGAPGEGEKESERTTESLRGG